MRSSPADYYAVLGVDPASEEVVIAAAYKALMRKYHPDVNCTPAAARKSKEINEAYEVLRDPVRRAAYDRLRSEASDAPPESARAESEVRAPDASSSDSRPRIPWGFVVVALIAGLVMLSVYAATPNTASVLNTANYATDDALMGNDVSAVEGLGDEPLKTQPEQSEVSDEQVKKAVYKFDSVFGRRGILGAATYSRECFKGVLRSQKLADFDFCVAFDLVAQQVDQAAAKQFQADPLGYFEDEKLKERHRDALRTLTHVDYLIDQSRIEDLADRTQEQLRYFALARQNKEDEVKSSSTSAPDAGGNSNLNEIGAPPGSPPAQLDRDFVDKATKGAE